METSDSECFESADDEIYSDSECAPTTKKKENIVNKISQKLNNCNISATAGLKIDTQVKDNTKISEPIKDQDEAKSDMNKNNSRSESKDSIESDINKNKSLFIEGLNISNKKESNIEEDSFKFKNEEKGNLTSSQSEIEEKANNRELEDNTDPSKSSPNDENLWENDGWEIDNLTDQETTVEKSTMPKVSSGTNTTTDTTNMWDNDEWEPIDNIQNIPNPDSNLNDDTWGNWGSWGVTSILNSATKSVSTLTTHVSQGLSTVIETGMGIPNPEELARIDQQVTSKEDNFKDVSNANPISFGLGNLSNFVSGVSNITKYVETTGSKVITGGLDTLETIGKKTMEVLQEGDPGLKKKRMFLNLEPQKPVLSQVLREAKEKAELESRILKEKHILNKKNYETLFDDHHGLVHLEALEMLSKQCEIKLENLAERYQEAELNEIRETLIQVKELCELPDEDEEEQLSLNEIKEKFKSIEAELGINITYDKLISTWEETEIWLNNLNLNICDKNELHQQAIETLAQLTAVAVEQYHKSGELLLIKEHHSTADEADSLVQLTSTLTSLIGIVAGKFTDKLNIIASKDSNENVNELITNVFFEAANSSSHIQDAFQLLISVLQVGAI